MFDARSHGPPVRDPSGYWVVTRHRDLTAALRDPRLSASTARGDVPVRPTDERAHVAARKAVLEPLSADAIARWRDQIEPLAVKLATDAARTAETEDVDLVSAFLRPYGLAWAVATTDAAAEDGERLAQVSADVFAAAASPEDAAIRPAADRAVVEVARAVRSPVDVQTFVALAHTLPCFLAGAWRALLEHPEALAALRTSGDVDGAIEELLRLEGPSKVVFRRALEDVVVGDVAVAAGERLALMLAVGNRDPARYPDPDRLDLARDASGHLAFGFGPHACAGATLTRVAASMATRVFVDALGDARVAREGGWYGGTAIGGPASLWVRRPPEMTTGNT